MNTFSNSSDLTTENFTDKLSILLDNIIIDLELPKNGLIIKQNSGKKKITYSVYINEPPFPSSKEDLQKINTTQSILNYEILDDSIILMISKNTFDYIELSDQVRFEEKSKFFKIFFPIIHPSLFTYISDVIYYRVKHYSSSAALFGCCDRFIECSDSKKCVHENKFYSTSCMYRWNLESGRIFYGKNRNID